MTFGHEEMLQQINRKCRVVAQTNCTLMYLNKEDFFKGIPEREQNLLAKEMVVFDVNAMANKILLQYEKVKQKNTALLDAAKINNCKFDGSRGK